MGSWDTYCALCGGPLCLRAVQISSERNKYALAARRNRVLRLKRTRADRSKHNCVLPRTRRLAVSPKADPIETASLQEEKRLDAALQREEPDKKLSDLNWSNLYDPEIVDEQRIEWLGRCRCLALNRQEESKAHGRAYLSRRGWDEDYGGFQINLDPSESLALDPNDPKLDVPDEPMLENLTCYHTFGYDDQDSPVFPFHEACYTVLAQTLHDDVDISRIDKDALYATMRQINQDDGVCSSLHLDYGHEKHGEQFWISEPGEEYLVCDPSIDLNISAVFMSILPPSLSKSRASLDLSSKIRSDPFIALPYDILHILVTALPTTDIYSLASASHYVYAQTRTTSFWKAMLKQRIIDVWFPELEDIHTALFSSATLDFKKLFLWLDAVTKPEFGMHGPFVHIANRRRIMHAVQELLPEYRVQVAGGKSFETNKALIEAAEAGGTSG